MCILYIDSILYKNEINIKYILTYFSSLLIQSILVDHLTNKFLSESQY